MIRNGVLRVKAGVLVKQCRGTDGVVTSLKQIKVYQTNQPDCNLYLGIDFGNQSRGRRCYHPVGTGPSPTGRRRGDDTVE